MLLFSVGFEFQNDLDDSLFSENLRQEFESQKMTLSQNISVKVEAKGNKWLITDKGNKQTYLIRREKGGLSIYDKTMTASKQIQGIEVKGNPQWWLSPPFLTTILGVIIGALLPSGANLLKDKMQERKEAAQKKKWLTDVLSSQIEGNRLDVRDEKETVFESWQDKLWNEGYFSELQKLTGKRSNPKDLPQDLRTAISRLREYENLRSKNRVTDAFKNDLAAKLATIAASLRKR